MPVLAVVAAVIAGLAFGTAHAQTNGSIRGVVSDKEFETPVPGAKVTIIELDRTVETTDQGNYVHNDVPPGVYTLVFSKSGYLRQARPNVVVSGGQLTEANMSMPGEFAELDEFVVQDALQLGGGNEAALLQLRFQSPQLLDSVSSELLSRAGASDAAAALKLVAGATVQANNSAVIRGLPDRYVANLLNGVRLPSADADKRAVQLDQFPAAAIESIQVSKTFTPDQQGDASGGAVDVRLKGVPDEPFFFRFRAQTGFNSQVRRRSDFLTYEGGGVSFSGRDNGNRAVQYDNIGANWEGAVGVTRDDAPLDYKWSIASGLSHDFENGFKVGAQGSFFYERDSSYYEGGRDERWVVSDNTGGSRVMTPQPIQGDAMAGDLITGLLDVTQASQSVQWGALGAVGAKYGEFTNLKLTYLFTRTTEDTVTLAEDTRGKLTLFPDYDPADPSTPGHGNDADLAPYVRQETLEYEERSIRSLQLSGDIEIPTGDFGIFKSPKVGGFFARSQADSEQPDKRQFASTWTPTRVAGTLVNPPTHRNLNPAANVNLGNLQRIYQNITETSDQFSVYFELPFEQWTENEGSIKVGYFDDDVQRTFDQDSFNNGNDPGQYFGGFDQFWSANFPFENHPIIESPFDIDYTGRQRLQAWYLMGELPLWAQMRAVGGFRMERTEIGIVNDPEDEAFYFPPNVRANTPTRLNPGDADVAFTTESPLPAIGLIYDPIPEVTLRASYAKTIARQTFKELTPILQQEFVGGPIFSGNPDLRNSELDNYDLRADYRPYAGGLVSISWFHKKIKDPIEVIQVFRTINFNTAVNYPDGEVTGTELETRHELGHFVEALDGLSVGANATFLNARVTLTEEEQRTFSDPGINVPTQRRDASNTPKHLYNLYLTYDYALTGTRLGLFYTVQGDTLVQGQGQARGDFVPDVYQKEFDNLNLTVSQALGKWVQLRFQAKNLTNPGIEEVYRSPVLANDSTRTHFKRGVDYSISLSGEVRF